MYKLIDERRLEERKREFRKNNFHTGRTQRAIKKTKTKPFYLNCVCVNVNEITYSIAGCITISIDIQSYSSKKFKFEGV